jgi:hypothetical protein
MHISTSWPFFEPVSSKSPKGFRKSCEDKD